MINEPASEGRPTDRGEGRNRNSLQGGFPVQRMSLD